MLFIFPLWLLIVLFYLNLADWHAATLLHPPRVGHEIVNDLAV